MARRIGGEWLSRDLPLTGVDSTLNLSGPGTISATLPPEVNRALFPDGMRMAEDWSTIIYEVNDDGQIVNHGIVLPPTAYEEASSRITCAGVSTYPNGYIFTDTRLWGPQAAVPERKNSKGKVVQEAKPAVPRPDPIAVYRDLWEWIQEQPQSDLGVVLTGDATTGTTKNAWGVEVPNVLIGTLADPVRYRKWDAVDIGSEMEALARDTPFDFVEKVHWGADGEPVHTIEVGYPRLGRKRDDLHFAQGENIIVTPTVQTIEGSANMIVGLGNGEAGPSMVYETSTWNDGRLRRHRVLTDKTLRSETLRRRMKVLENALGQRYDVTQIAIIDHPNARISSIQLGDEIGVVADHPDYGPISLTVRVLSITRGASDEVAILTTSAAAFFNYSPTEEVT
jgi:hypothetical protein